MASQRFRAAVKKLKNCRLWSGEVLGDMATPTFLYNFPVVCITRQDPAHSWMLHVGDDLLVEVIHEVDGL